LYIKHSKKVKRQNKTSNPMQYTTHVPAHQQTALGNHSAEIDNITRSWSSTELAANIHAQHVWNSKLREYKCADIRPDVDRNELSVSLTTLTEELCTGWQQSMGLVDENDHLLTEWNSLYGGPLYDSEDDDDALLSVARPDELFPSPKFFYELHQAMTVFAQCKNEKNQLQTYKGNGRGNIRNSMVQQIPRNAAIQQQLHQQTERRCILAFKPLIDEWRVRHPRPPSTHPMPIPVRNHVDMLELRQCIVILHDFLASLTVAEVLRIADLCCQSAMDIMEFQLVDWDETTMHQYLLPQQHLQQRLRLDLRTIIMFPHTTNIQHLCPTWEERGSEGKCSDVQCVCCSCDSTLFRISDTLTILGLRHEVGKLYESSDLLKKNRHGAFYMNFYMDAHVDLSTRDTIFHPEIDQKTHENTSIADLFLRQPGIQAPLDADCILYACDSTCNGRIPAASTTT